MTGGCSSSASPRRAHGRPGGSCRAIPLAVYAVPYAAVAMMLTVLVGGRTALATQIAGALHVGIMSGQVELVAYALVPALLGMGMVRRATTAREFVAAARSSGGNLGVIATFVLVGRPGDTLAR